MRLGGKFPIHCSIYTQGDNRQEEKDTNTVGDTTQSCCCSLCCVRASLQSPCRVLWSCVLHFTSSVIVSRVLWKLCYTPQALGGTHAQIHDACIQSSPLWSKFEIRHLTQLIWNAQDPKYVEFVNAIGDSASPEIDLWILSSTTQKEDIISFVVPPDVLLDPLACLPHGILMPTNKQVNEYNSILLERVHRQYRQYFAADSLKEASKSRLDSIDFEHSILDYVACQTPPRLPPHCSEIKTCTVYHLLQNFSINCQLVKNTCIVVTEIGNQIITAKVLRDRPTSGNYVEEDIVIPRITFSHVLSSGHFASSTISSSTCI